MSPHQPKGPSGRRPTILVVDDEKAVREILSRFLVRAGYEVLAADSGEAALELARTRRPDAIVLDMLLPDLTGREVIERLRTRPESRKTPVLIISGGFLERMSPEMGRVETLEKPMRPAELVRQVDRLLRPEKGPSAERRKRPPSLPDFPE